MTEKDYSLLRPFDLAAAKAGKKLINTGNGDTSEYIAGPDAKNAIIVRNDRDGVFYGSTYYHVHYRMAPLAWVEGKPVYKGAVLYNEVSGDKRTISGASETRLFADELHRNVGALVSDLTWNPPKVKREGYTLVQKASVHKDKRDAESFLSLLGEPERWAICHVEWEEPA